jgi:hypothetical protein
MSTVWPAARDCAAQSDLQSGSADLYGSVEKQDCGEVLVRVCWGQPLDVHLQGKDALAGIGGRRGVCAANVE